jgi:uncharacterized protein (TIGR04255 family)
MVQPRDLKRAPITEALVDVRILADATLTAERLRPLAESIADEYPKLDERRGFSAQLRVEGGKIVPSSQDLGFGGIWLTSRDGNRIAQFRTDGFTLNNVGGGYVGGDVLIDEALRLWEMFAHVVRASAVTRLALRYINRLELPLKGGDDFGRFLAKPPELPPEAPQAFSKFLSRIEAEDGATKATVVVTQKFDGTEGPTVPVPVIIDIDAFFPRQSDASTATLRRELVVLRALKNRCFFSLLTEAAVNLYQ